MTRDELQVRIKKLMRISASTDVAAIAHDYLAEAHASAAVNLMHSPTQTCMLSFVDMSHKLMTNEVDALLDEVFGTDEQGNPLEHLSEVIGKVVPCDEESIDRLIDHLREHGELNLGNGELSFTFSDKHGWQVALPDKMRINKENAKDVFEALAAAYCVMMEYVE